MTREARITIFLLILVVLFAVLAAVAEARAASQIPLLSSSAEPNGAKALSLWLDKLDYDVDTRTLATFEIPSGVTTVLMLEPTTGVAVRELEALDEWVETGGTLLLAVSDNQAGALLARHYDFDLVSEFSSEVELTPATPLLRDVVGWDSAELRPTYALRSNSDFPDFTTLLALDDVPVAVSIEEGDGHVILTTLTDPFSNNGIKRMGNGELVLNLIGLVDSADKGSIWFNDWHHGVRNIDTEQILGPYAWLRRTWAGRAIIYSTLIGVAIIIWQGRRFGRVVPLTKSQQRRAPLEYISAIASLNRRANNRSAVLTDYRQRLKRKLGARYRIDPTLPDDAYLRQLQHANPSLDHRAISTLLQCLRNERITEAELVDLAQQVSDFLQN